ncbi:MAG: SpoIID/LytB domain-containing protein, partial [Bacteroidales bacterium]|nr:SpoIID/LytB domain-containing protein [Bacteroidales bacterium]
DHTDFDVCADDHCQRYQGLTRANTEAVVEAVKETWGEVLMVKEGRKKVLCDTRFSKCCGGMLEQFRYCWENVRHSYLISRRDSVRACAMPDLTDEETVRHWIMNSPVSFCNTTDGKILSQVLNNYDQETANFYRWKVEYTQQEISELIRRRTGIDFGSIIDLVPVARGTSGRIWKLKILGTKRTRIIGKELAIRRALSPTHLYSSAFVVEKPSVAIVSQITGKVLSEEEIASGKYVSLAAAPEKFILYGAGWGHGVGLCQIGAAVMGEQGYDYREILEHYYPSSQLTEKY